MGSFGGWTDLATYRRAHGKGSLPMRIYSFVPISSWAKLPINFTPGFSKNAASLSNPAVG